MTSPFAQFFENLNLFSFCGGLSPHQIWFKLDQGGGEFRRPMLRIGQIENRLGEIGLKTRFYSGLNIYTFSGLRTK